MSANEMNFTAAERAALSYAVGEWARVWPLQQLVRAMGAYFVRRRSGDALAHRFRSRQASDAGADNDVMRRGHRVTSP